VTLWTIGHSTLALDDFLARLEAHRIEHLADVRRVPRSRRHPHFSGPALAAALARTRIGYSHHDALGGMRTPRPDSRNRAWRNEAFRGYADHMATSEFEAALDELIARARGTRLAVMCAEADFMQCHRRLIADALVARGVEVLHIRGTDPAIPHTVTPGARVEGGKVTYPGDDLFDRDTTEG
jgi:uncharacterized protein (DUF488 family)